MEVEHHDEVLAATSHLPHLLAFTLVDSLAKRSENLEIFRYAAGGFRDFTDRRQRPVMWHDIFLANREAVLRTLDVFVTTSTRCARPSTLGRAPVVGRFHAPG
ncbi:prephenate dehydrogenase dimerization domain-containing protein [Pseudomonas aeruginosa]